MPPAYRLGIDLGINSLGWCAVRLNGRGEPDSILDVGVRLFTDGRDPKTGTSLAADRRVARQMRRRRDRYLRRRGDLMEALVEHGLMPADPTARKALEALDPYELRARGLGERLEPHHLGRALFHLNQRRGFKSSRKNLGDEKESGLIDAGIGRLRDALHVGGHRTVGEYLWARHNRRDENGQRPSVRVRLQGAGKDAHYEFYPQRALLEEEFDKLWAKQAEFHPTLLTESTKAALKDLIFFQRPLKPVVPGRCTLDPSERRAPWALPLAQRFRIYQELANLRIERLGESRALTRAERDAVFAKLERKPKLTFKQIATALKLDATHRFNLEAPNRDGLKGDDTGIRLAKDRLFGKGWWALPAERQAEIVETILAADDDAALAEIAQRDWGLAEPNARAVARVALPEGHANVGRAAMARIVPVMVEQGLDYHHAAKSAGYEPSDFRGDGVMDALPYYGEILDRQVIGDSGNPDDPAEKQFGRFPNPTVHIALNQVRAVINALIERHGKPTEIVVELARELKQNKKQKDAHNKRVAEDTVRNAKIAEKLGTLGIENTALNRKIYKLWEELGPPEDRRCVYTGQQIPATKIFSPEFAIDHILPFSRTLDDGMENLVLCAAGANRAKTNLTPHEWKGHEAGWDEILLRADKLPPKKRRRFSPDAMEWWLREEADFVARHLTDTQWIAKAAKEYLGGICPADRVWATPGRLTHLLRGKWGLNTILADLRRGTLTNDPAAGEDTEAAAGVPKNRNDHRHHAIDAFVVALTARGILNRVAQAAGRSSPDRIIDDMPEPWPGFRNDLRQSIGNVVVALKPDHGKQGRLHEDTAYGLIERPEDWGGHNVVYRKSFADLNENEIERIRDPDLRAQVQAHIAAAKGTGTIAGAALKAALAAFKDRNGVTPRRVRLTKAESPLIPIRHRKNGPVYKAVAAGENWCIDIFEQPDGSWHGSPITLFEANNPGTLDEKRKGHPAARRVLRIHKGDYLKLRNGSADEIYRVVRLNARASRLYLAAHHEAGDLQRRHEKKESEYRDDPFRWLLASYATLKERRARKVSVDVLGHVRDPGPPKGLPG
jgi:CRISPR-associated endonuclease Csn1